MDRGRGRGRISRPGDNRNGNIQHKSTSDQKKVVCRFLESASGCQKGKDCTFLHPPKPNVAKTIIKRKDQICENWMKGECKYGEKCRFAHGENDLTSPEESNPLYKTTMCSSYPDGECSKGPACSFAHSEAELRKLDQTAIIKMKKMKTCKNILEKGFCQHQSECHFNHDVQNQNNQNSQFHSQQFMQQQPNMAGFQGLPNNIPQLTFNCVSLENMISMYSGDGSSQLRTTMCKTFMEEKKCSFGERCRHAHKISEMIMIPEKDPGNKGTLCKMFEEKQECKWGDKCRFSHGKKELFKHIQKPGMYPANCKQFIEGTCIYGINCSYTHSVPNDNYGWKASKCRNLEEGECKFGANCSFSHTDKDRRTTEENAELIELRKNMNVVQEWKQMGLFVPEMFQRTMAQMSGGGGGLMMGRELQMMRGEPQMMGDDPQMMRGSQERMMSSQERMMIGMRRGGLSMFDGFEDGGMGTSSGQMAATKRPVLLPDTIANLPKKAELCPLWLDDGNCLAANSTCLYAHGQRELLKIKEQLARSAQVSMKPEHPMPSSINLNDLSTPLMDGKYKVVMCEFRADNCPTGSRCNFAHSYDELYYFRLKQVPNYKRTICKSWEDTGSCQWEKTCMFAHGHKELSEALAMDNPQ